MSKALSKWAVSSGSSALILSIVVAVVVVQAAPVVLVVKVNLEVKETSGRVKPR